MTPPRQSWRRAVRDALLLPVALLVVVLEDVLWRGARAVLRQISDLPAMRGLSVRLARLPGWAALPVFLLPESAGRLGELWAAWLLYRGHPKSAVMVYALVRLLATLIVVFIWQACEPALMRLAWFARLAGWVRAVRDWALSRTAGLRRRIRGLAGHGSVTRRIAALSRRLRMRWRT